MSSAYCASRCITDQKQETERIGILIVYTNDLCEDELGSEMLYLLGYEWTPPLEVNATRVSYAAGISTIDAKGIWSPPLETSATTIGLMQLLYRKTITSL
jgi:hypothetical protein